MKACLIVLELRDIAKSISPTWRTAHRALLILVATCGFVSHGYADEMKADVKHDESTALGDAAHELQARKAAAGSPAIIQHKEHRVRPVPLPKRAHAPAAASAQPSTQPLAHAQALSVTPGIQFEGVGKGLNYTIEHAPPDTNGSVGPNDYVQWVNEAFAVFDKQTGTTKLAATDGSALWKGFGGNCEHSNDGDPITLYDKAAGRWVMTQFSVSNGPPYSQCIAVSKTADPLGSYVRYEFQFPEFNDYPKFGVWADGYYAAFNMFSGQAFAGAKVCAFERAKMLVGQSASMKCFDLPDFAGLLPSDMDGSAPPPPGSPNYFINFGDNALNLWRFQVDWNVPANSTLSGPISIPVGAFDPACDGGDCIPQPHTPQKLSSLADRMMYRLAYRNFGDHESLVVNHTVKHGTSVGVRWYELRNPRGTPEVHQQGTYAPSAAYRWMGSAAMDKNGNMLLGYSAASTRSFPSIRYAGRRAADPPNVLSAEHIAKSGKGSQTATLDRWGDYSSISVDPSDDCTFWFTTQYLADTGQFNWHTRVFSVKFNDCSGP